MTSGERLFLLLAIAAFAAFAVVLAYYSRRPGLTEQTRAPALPAPDAAPHRA